MKKQRRQEKMSKPILTLGRIIAPVLTLILFYTSLVAYFNPSKKITIFVNQLGEANIEAILVIVLIPLMVYCIIEGIRDLIELRKERTFK
ncbi:MAG: hypothetical protein ACTSPI_16725 [Candidatus Heimdallarchaeaceae archaeon]